MSFYFEFVSVSADDAKAKIRDQYAPESIKDFLCSAVNGVEARYKKTQSVHDQETDVVSVVYIVYIVYFVKANGHLCDGENHDVSSAVLEVRGIPIG